jgi:hypothetical protein
MAEFCCIRYPDGTGHTVMGDSLFDAAAAILSRWTLDRLPIKRVR